MTAPPYRLGIAPLRGFRAHPRPVHIAILAILFAMAPAFALLTWPPSPSTLVPRFFAVPILVAEMALVGLAIADGFRPSDAFRDLKPTTRFAAIAWIASASLSMLIARAVPGIATILFATMLLHALAGLAMRNRVRNGRIANSDRIYLALAWGMAGYLEPLIRQSPMVPPSAQPAFRNLQGFHSIHHQH